MEPASGRASPPGGRGAALRALVRDTVRGLRGHDLPLHAAGATFYAGVAVVPALLVAIWGVSLVLGEVQVRTYGHELAALPAALGAPLVARGLCRPRPARPR